MVGILNLLNILLQHGIVNLIHLNYFAALSLKLNRKQVFTVYDHKYPGAQNQS